MLRSLGFLLWSMGSHGVVVRNKLASWRDPYGCCVAAETLEVIDDLNPCNLCFLENATPTHSTHVLPLSTGLLKK